MNKQIDEMARVLEFVCDLQDKDSCIADCDICRAKALYNAGYRKTEWISVEERLPENEGIYLAYTTRGHIEIAHFYPYYVSGKPQFDYWITHWMPLPMPPKGDEGK